MSVTIFSVTRYQDANGAVYRRTERLGTVRLTPEQIKRARNEGFIVKPIEAQA